MGTTNRIRIILTAVLIGIIAAACGGGSEDENADEIRDIIRAELLEEGDVSEEQADCIIDDALEAHSLSELATLDDDEPDIEVVESMTSIALDCLLNTGPGLSGLLDDDEDDQTAATTVPPTTVAPTTSEPDPLTVSSPAFCNASADAYETLSAGDYFEDTTPEPVVVAWADQVESTTAAAVAAAPNDELAAAPEAFLDAWSTLALVFPPGGTFADFGADPNTVGQMETVAEIIGALESYLEGPCELDDLEANAEGVAAQLIDEHGTGSTGGPTPDSAGNVSIMDPVSDIWLDVPAAWSDQRSEDGAVRSITVSTDVAEYDASWRVSGVMITAVDVPVGSADWIPAEAAAAAWSNCDFVSTEVYDDGVYTGMLTRFDNCSGTDTEAVVVGATNAGENVEILVEIQIADGDFGAIDTVLTSFLV